MKNRYLFYKKRYTNKHGLSDIGEMLIIGSLKKFLNKDFKKTFDDLTKFVLSLTKLPLKKWIEHANNILDCMKTFMGVED